MPDVLQTLIPYVVVGMLLVAGILFVFALWYFRRGKREPYWRMRRAASLHGWELFLVSVVLVFLAAGVCLFSGLAQAVLGGSTPVATFSEGEVLFITATPELDATSRPTGAAATPTTSSQTPQTAQLLQALPSQRRWHAATHIPARQRSIRHAPADGPAYSNSRARGSGRGRHAARNRA